MTTFTRRLTLFALSAAALVPLAPASAGGCDRETSVRFDRGFSRGHDSRLVRLADDTVRRHAVDTYRVRFSGGERVVLGAHGDGFLALRVVDDHGRTVAFADDHRRPELAFRTVRSAVYTVQVVNRDRAAVDYVLVAR